jgi:hypothetical protein
MLAGSAGEADLRALFSQDSGQARRRSSRIGR